MYADDLALSDTENVNLTAKQFRLEVSFYTTVHPGHPWEIGAWISAHVADSEWSDIRRSQTDYSDDIYGG
jgi:hypothetical protein